MKAFAFRLDQALRWREAQAGAQKSRLAAAVARASGIEAGLRAQKAEATEGAAAIMRAPTGEALAAYAAFTEKSRARTRDLESQLGAARQAVGKEAGRVVEANRRTRLIEKLRSSGRTRWRSEFDRELTAFADEAFLIGLQSKKRTGA